MQPWAYFDTSVLAKRYVAAEEGIAHARRALRSHRILTSAVSFVELASAFRQRSRAGDLSATGYRAILARMASDRACWDLLAVGDEVLRRAESVVDRTGVRALDAVHLASAWIRRDAGLPNLPFVTADRRQADGARALGLTTMLVE